MNLTLCREDGLYHPGETLTASWRISRVPLEQVQGLEVSVLWHTEGKGDEDFHVHHFHRQGESQIRRSGLADARSTHCALPATPLSYHGKLISVRWCIRLRLFLTSGREIVTEQPFHLIHPTMVNRIDLADQQNVDSAAAESAAVEADSEMALALKPELADRSLRAVKRSSSPSSAT